MTITRSQLNRVALKWAPTGAEPGPLDRLLEKARTAEQHLRDAHKSFVAEADAQATRAPDRLVEDPTPQRFAEVAAEVTGLAAQAAEARNLLTRSVARVYAQAGAGLAAVWSEVEPQLITAHDEMMAELDKLAPKLAGIPDDQAAVRAGASTATAWAKANELVERRTAIIALREEMADVLGLDGYKRDDELRQYRHPERLRSWHPRDPDSPRHQVTRLLDDMDAGAGPALCTDAEVAATLDRTDGALRPAKVHPFAADRIHSEQLLASLGPAEV